jgi:hypothetical protein
LPSYAPARAAKLAGIFFAYLVACLAFAGRAHAADFTWTGAAGNGLFQDPNNWSPAGGPPDDVTDVAIFDQPRTQLVQLSNSVTIRQLLLPVDGTELTFQLDGWTLETTRADEPSVVLSPTTAGGNKLVITNGQVRARDVHAADSSVDFSSGLVRVGSNGLLHATNQLNVGSREGVSLSVVDGGQVIVDGTTKIGSSGTAHAIVSGDDSTLQTDWLIVGPTNPSVSHGMLTISDGGQLHTRNTRLGESASALTHLANITITGSGSTWINTQGVGGSSPAIDSVDVVNGGRFVTHNLSADRLHVADPGSVLQVTGELELGNVDAEFAHFELGARVTTGSIRMVRGGFFGGCSLLAESGAIIETGDVVVECPRTVHNFTIRGTGTRVALRDDASLSLGGDFLFNDTAYPGILSIEGGSLVSGRQLTQISAVGSLTLNNGMLQLRGDTNVEGEVNWIAGEFVQDAGTTISVQNGGELNIGNALTVPSNAVLEVLSYGRAFGHFTPTSPPSEVVAAGQVSTSAGAVIHMGGARFSESGRPMGVPRIAASDVHIVADSTLSGHGQVDADVLNEGLLKPSQLPDQLVLQRDFTQSASGVLQVDIKGTGAMEFDQLKVIDLAMLGGTLELVLDDTLEPQVGLAVPFLTYGSRSGEFDRIVMTPHLPEWRVSVNYDDTAGQASAVFMPIPEPAFGWPAAAGICAFAWRLKRRRRPRLGECRS